MQSLFTMNSDFELFPEIELFLDNEALPKEWDFILEPNIELDLSPITIQLQVRYEQEMRRMTLSPSTLSGEYSLVHLQRLIVSAFNLKKNSMLQIFCAQTNSILQTDTQFVDAISKVSFSNTSLSLKVSLIQEEEPCILCVSYECCHSTTRTFGKKRKVHEDTLLPQFLQPVSSRKDENKIPKRRKLVLSGSSVSKAPLSVSHAINASFPKQILINF